MIPGIEDIVQMLLSGQCTQAQAVAWLNRHVELAEEVQANQGEAPQHEAPAVPTNWQTERTQFQEWALRINGPDALLEERGGSDYEQLETKFAWEGWSARAALAAPREKREPGVGAQAWLELVQKQVAHIRENAQGLRKFPGTEQEARARELGAQYLLEAAQSLARAETHAKTLEGIAGVSRRLDSIRATLAAPRPEAQPTQAGGEHQQESSIHAGSQAIDGGLSTSPQAEPTPSAAVSEYPPLPDPGHDYITVNYIGAPSRQEAAFTANDMHASMTDKPEELRERALPALEEAQSSALLRARAKIVAHRDSHCADTGECNPNGRDCGFVAAWNDAIRLIDEALEGADAVQGWRTIDSAPKDAPLLGYGEDAGEINGPSGTLSIQVMTFCGRGDYAGFEWTIAGDAYANWFKPTHWMSLPEAPPPPVLPDRSET